MAHQSVLTGYAPRCPVLMNPRISQAAPALVWPTLVRSLITLLDPRHHRGVAVDVWVHGLRDLLFGPMSGSLTLASSLRLQDTVVVALYQRIIHQRVESPGVLALFRLVPRVFKGNNF
jgi:hypothetical protein